MLRRSALCVIVLAMSATVLRAQSVSSQKTVLDGIYSEEQAERGRVAFATTCARCHGSNLEGVAGPTLTGEHFIEHWREDTLDSIYNFMREGMPPGRNNGGP